MAYTTDLNIANLGANKIINGGGHVWQRLGNGCGYFSASLTWTSGTVTSVPIFQYVDIGTGVIGTGITGVATVTAVNRNTGAITISQSISTSGTYHFGVAANGTSKYVADRFKLFGTSGGSLASTVYSFKPSTKSDGSTGSFRIEANGAVTASASDRLQFNHLLEGYTTNLMLSHNFNLVFDFKASASGTYSVRLCNPAGTKNYFIPFTYSTAGSWQTIKLRLPTVRSADTYSTSNGLGLSICWPVVAGSSTLATTNLSWDETATGGVVGQANPLGTAGGYFEVANIYMGEGESFSMAGNTIAGELMMCRRYYEKMPRIWCRAIGTTEWYFIWNYMATKRIYGPSVSFYSNYYYTESIPMATAKIGSGSTLNQHHNTDKAYAAKINGFTGLTDGGMGFFDEDSLYSDAEL